MAQNLRLNIQSVQPFIKNHELDQMKKAVADAHEALHEKTGAGREFTGWVDLPLTYDREELARLIEVGGGAPKTGSPCRGWYRRLLFGGPDGH